MPYPVTAPWQLTLDNQAITPRRDQTQYFIDLMEQGIARNRQVLPPAALQEFQQARKVYRERLARAK